jgi:hypothetical protein
MRRHLGKLTPGVDKSPKPQRGKEGREVARSVPIRQPKALEKRTTCQSNVKRNAYSRAASRFQWVGMRKNGRERPFRVLKMRARRRGPARVSHRLLVRYHGAASLSMTACRLQCIDLESEMARCEELGELLATEQ